MKGDGVFQSMGQRGAGSEESGDGCRSSIFADYKALDMDNNGVCTPVES